MIKPELVVPSTNSDKTYSFVMIKRFGHSPRETKQLQPVRRGYIFFKMAAPVAGIFRRCICSEARKTRVRRPRPHIDKIIRVDHAGELGADRIYAGQMAVLGKTSVGPTIQVRKAQ